MTDKRYDPEAEENLLGWCINNVRDFDEIAETLTPEDFYVPANRTLFELMVDMRRHDLSLAMGTIVAEGRRRNLDLGSELVTMQTYASADYRHSASLLVEWRAARAIEAAGIHIAKQALDMTLSPEEKLERATSALLIDLPSTALQKLANFYRQDEYMARPTETVAPWIIPGMLRRGWRCLIVAEEGLGKSMMLRQIATAVAHGVHPFSNALIEPKRTMIVDLENPPDIINATMRRIDGWVRHRSVDYDPERWSFWEEPGGIDLRSRRDQHQLRARILDARPDVVCLGPLYKAYRATAKETDEIAAGEVMRFLDELRTDPTHGFSLLLEHHAPKAQGGKRDILPYGSSLWARWPEFGIKMLPAQDARPDSVTLGRWRRDRVQDLWWPDRIDRGALSEPPWVGYWTNPNTAAPVGALPQTRQR